MYSKTSGKVLRDNKTFLNLMRQGRLTYNITNIRPFCLKYYKHYVRNTNIHCDELTGIQYGRIEDSRGWIRIVEV